MEPMRDRSWSDNWFGVALIGLGLLFLVQNYLGYELHNWWALFILIPAVGSFGAAYSLWRAHGSPTAAASSFTMGVLFTAVAAIFLLELPWGRVWPVFIILAGLAMLLPNLMTRREKI
jgi:hypothetical protein